MFGDCGSTRATWVRVAKPQAGGFLGLFFPEECSGKCRFFWKKLGCVLLVEFAEPLELPSPVGVDAETYMCVFSILRMAFAVQKWKKLVRRSAYSRDAPGSWLVAILWMVKLSKSCVKRVVFYAMWWPKI